jgi:putative Holliday junction resolvase
VCVAGAGVVLPTSRDWAEAVAPDAWTAASSASVGMADGLWTDAESGSSPTKGSTSQGAASMVATVPKPTKKPVMGIDLGKVRVGVAISDELGLLAHPRAPLDGTNRRRLLESLRALADDEGVERFVVGWPIDMHGGEGLAASKAERFAEELAGATGRIVELVDERWSTVEAHRRLREGGVRGHERQGKVDSAAAALLLQSWLDARPRS